MNIHKSQLFWWELQGYKVLTHCHISLSYHIRFPYWWKLLAWWNRSTCPMKSHEPNPMNKPMKFDSKPLTMPWKAPSKIPFKPIQNAMKFHSKSGKHHFSFEIWKAPFFPVTCVQHFSSRARGSRRWNDRTRPAPCAGRRWKMVYGDPKWWRFHHYMNDIIVWLIWLLYRCHPY